MSKRYPVYPVPTTNIPEMHPGVYFLNYEGDAGNGEIVDVRVRYNMENEPEIILVQVIHDDGRVLRTLSADEVELMP